MCMTSINIIGVVVVDMGSTGWRLGLADLPTQVVVAALGAGVVEELVLVVEEEVLVFEEVLVATLSGEVDLVEYFGYFE